MILCIGLVAAYNICDYMLLSYMPTYLSGDSATAAPTVC